MSLASGTLVVAPYIGEFGWELMNWQARVRHVVMHGGHRRVVICARTDRHPLYAYPGEEGRVVFCPLGGFDLPGYANDDHRIDADNHPYRPDYLRGVIEAKVSVACARLGIDTADAEMLIPEYTSRMWPTSATHQDFAEFRLGESVTTDVLLVPRNRALMEERNQPTDWWDELVERLRGRGLVVEVYTPRLDEAIRQLSRTRLAVGASTGGLHLASLCRCPHYVWGPGDEARWTALGMTNRQRYETVWNPFGTPCRFDECGWQPSVDLVVERTLVALDEIGLVPGQRKPSWTLNSKWRVKRRLARLLEPESGNDRVPWKIRNLVREHLV